MKKYAFVVLVASLLFISFSGCTPAKVLNEVKIFETLKNSRSNSSSAAVALSNALKASNSKHSEVIKIPTGRYDFYEEGAFTRELYISNHDQDNPKKVAFIFENLKNVTIDGQGSAFVFHGRMIPIVLINCENVTLKNFSVDFEYPHLRQLEILSVNKDADELTASIYPTGNYSVKDKKLFIEGEGYSYTPGLSMAFRADKRLTYIRRDVAFNPKEVSEVSSNTFKIKGWDQIALTSPGERYALRTYYRPTPGIVIDFCKNTKLENVTVHYSEGMGLIAQMSENITLNKFSVKLKGDTDLRYFTTQADATHFSACKGLILSENGIYEGMADDAINVHGTYLKIIKRIDNRTVQARYMHPQAYGFLWGENGDEVQMIESEKMESIDNSHNKIAAIKTVDKPTAFGAKVYEITFEKDIPAVISEQGKFAVENLTWTPEVIFRNNIVRNNRARGALFSTPKKVVVENNLFDHTHGTAILLCGDANGWYETGQCKDVIIRNNKFINALTANYQFTNAVISIYPEIPNLKAQQKYFHSGIVIENNLFETFDRPLLYAKSTDGLVFRNNTITYNQEFEPFHWNKHIFFFERVNNISIEKNKFAKPLQPQNDIRTELSEVSAVKIVE